MAPIDVCLEQWFKHLAGDLPGGLDELLHDDVTFWSPIVHTPQQGKEITKLYLSAAGNTLAGGEKVAKPDADADADSEGTAVAEGAAGTPDGPANAGGFRYVRTVAQGHDAVLEFETTMDGLYVNGVDLLTCDDDGKIVAIKVMIRPLKAINAVHEQMRRMLEKLQSS
jgi:hypothetical protein